jgi:hypothetical protein
MYSQVTGASRLRYRRLLKVPFLMPPNPNEYLLVPLVYVDMGKNKMVAVK